MTASKQTRMLPLGTCPCGGQILASADGEVPAVAHSVPYCAEFERLEPDEFLTYVRKARGISAPWDEPHETATQQKT